MAGRLKQLLEHEEELRRLKLDDDKHYARNYLNLAQSQRTRALGLFVGPLIALGFCGAVVFAMVFNLIIEFIFGLIGAIVLGLIVRFWLQIRDVRQREAMYDATVERKNGIDRRWGRSASNKTE